MPMMFGSSEIYREAARRFVSPPPATIQIDLDGYWAIRRCYGLEPEGTFERDPVFTDGLPRALHLLGQLKIPATFFVVGRDAALDSKAAILRRAAAEGHRLGNHTYSHRIDFAALAPPEMREEIHAAQEAIAGATGVTPATFRAPGYNMSGELMKLLREAGLRGDASVLPSPWGWLFRAVSQTISGGRGVRRGGQFGSRASAGAPLWPYYPSAKNFACEAIDPSPADLLEWPVGVDPLTRAPLTGTILFLLGRAFMRGALRRFRQTGLPLNFVLHGIDFVDTRLYPPLDSTYGNAFFKTPLPRKMDLMQRALKFIQRNYTLTTLDEEASPESHDEFIKLA